MTPEQQTQFEELQAKVEELLKWKEEKIRQQISYPLDEASQQVISGI